MEKLFRINIAILIIVSISLSTLVFSSCNDNNEEIELPRNPQDKIPGSDAKILPEYVGFWADFHYKKVFIFNADGTGISGGRDELLYNKAFNFSWKVDKNKVIWFQIGDTQIWNTWTNSRVISDVLGFTHSAATGTLDYHLAKIEKPYNKDYVGKWRITKATQSVNNSWNNAMDVTALHIDKVIIFRPNGIYGDEKSMEKWIYDQVNNVIWIYNPSEVLGEWAPVSVVHVPSNGEMTLIFSEKGKESLKLELNLKESLI